MNWKFCMLCGGEFKPNSKHAWKCLECGQNVYRNAAGCADAAIVNEKDELLIAIRGADPGKGKWDLPGGFVDIGETFEQALERELGEELGMSFSDTQSVTYLSSGAGEYAWGRDVTYVVAATFLVRISSDTELLARDDVDKVMWVPFKNVDYKKLFFKPHQKAIEKLILLR